MAVMIFGKPPSLEGIVETLGALEEEVNSH
jgi:hypothetical protein